MKKLLLLPLLFLFVTFANGQSDIIITGTFDGPLSGGTPKGVELYTTAAIADLSLYGVGSANNGNGTDGEEFTFPAVAIPAGTFIYVTPDSLRFEQFFGSQTNYWTDNAMSINGDDAVELFFNGSVVDVIGDINMDGTGTAWDHVDGWLYRKDGTISTDTVWTISNFIASGTNQLEGDTVNSGCTKPFPIGSYNPNPTPAATVQATSSNTFVPANVTIMLDETVSFVNTGGFHNVNGSQTTYPSNPASFGFPTPSSALWTYNHTFTIAGVYDYVCDPHAGLGMTGTVTVLAGSPPPAIPTYPIGLVTTNDANGQPDSLGVVCKISGVVHGIDMQGGTNVQFTVIDPSDDMGIGVFGTSNHAKAYTVNEGDLVEMEGTVTFFNGLTQFSPDSIHLMGSGALSMTTNVTALGENTESQLATFQNATLVDPSTWNTGGGSFNTLVTNGPDTIAVRIDSDVDIAGMAAPLGTFDITGIGGQFDNSSPYDAGYQLFPRYVADISPYVTTMPSIPTYPIGLISTNDATGQPDSIGVVCKISGVVHGVDMQGGTNVQFTVIDPSDNMGIGVFGTSDHAKAYTVNEGDLVEMEGTVSFFNGLTQFSPDSIHLIGSGSLSATMNVTALDESTESQLVTFQNATLVDPGTWNSGGGSFNTMVTNGPDTIAVRIDSDVSIAGMNAPLGTFSITGLGGQFDNSSPYDDGYQLFPRYVADITPYVTTLPSYPTYTIGDVTGIDANGVADSSGVMCTLQGIVHGENFRPGGLQFTLIDSNNDGIGVFEFGNDFGYTVNEGDQIQVQGTISQFNGLTQIEPDTVITIGSGSIQSPMTVTMLDESTESQVIGVTGVSIVDPAQWTGAGSGFNVDFTDGTNTYSVRIDNDCNLYSTPAPSASDIYRIDGIGGQFDGSSPYDMGYQLLPRRMSDMTMLTNTTNIFEGKVELMPNPSSGLFKIESEEIVEEVQVYDTQGKLVHQSNVKATSTTIDLSDKSSGIYLIRLSNGTESWNGKIVKQ